MHDISGGVGEESTLVPRGVTIRLYAFAAVCVLTRGECLRSMKGDLDLPTPIGHVRALRAIWQAGGFINGAPHLTENDFGAALVQIAFEPITWVSRAKSCPATGGGRSRRSALPLGSLEAIAESFS